jgi:hypothetical protein
MNCYPSLGRTPAESTSSGCTPRSFRGGARCPNNSIRRSSQPTTQPTDPACRNRQPPQTEREHVLTRRMPRVGPRDTRVRKADVRPDPSSRSRRGVTLLRPACLRAGRLRSAGRRPGAHCRPVVRVVGVTLGSDRATGWRVGRRVLQRSHSDPNDPRHRRGPHEFCRPQHRL